MNNDHAAEIVELLEALNTADPERVWDTVIYPRLTPGEQDQVTTDMVRRGTFIHHRIPYGRAYYSGTWTTLLTAADLISASSTGAPGHPQTVTMTG